MGNIPYVNFNRFMLTDLKTDNTFASRTVYSIKKKFSMVLDFTFSITDKKVEEVIGKRRQLIIKRGD